MSSVDVSVIIPTYNCASFIKEALDSVFAQTRTPKEIIVVDDGSTDGTWELLQKYKDRVKIIHQQNAGPAAARNRGIREAQCAFVAFQDADDLWLPRKLEIQMEMLRRRPNIDMVTGNGVWMNEVRSDATDVLHDAEPVVFQPSLESLLLKRIICTPCVLVRKDALIAVGGFDETLLAAEDWDLWLRLARHNRILYACTPLAHIRRHPSNRSKDADQMRNAGLRVINKLYSDASTNLSKIVRRQAKARLYLEAGIEYMESRNRFAALRNMAISIWYWPLGVSRLGYRSRTAFVIRAMLGESLFRNFVAILRHKAHLK